MSDKRMFAITEAKDLLVDINNAISKTREKSWQLLAFLIAMNVYFITSVLEGKNSYLFFGLSLLIIVGDIVIGKHLYFCLFPNKIHSNGGYPTIINSTIEQENKPDGIDFYEVLTYNYEWVIKENSVTLQKMTTKYKSALYGLIFLSGAILLFILLFFMFVKLNQFGISS